MIALDLSISCPSVLRRGALSINFSQNNSAWRRDRGDVEALAIVACCNSLGTPHSTPTQHESKVSIKALI
jgi:hypothetical protein